MSEAGPSTRRGPVDERDRLRREHLLDAGLEAFGTVGYAASAIESICADAHVGTRSFYRYFSSKEDLLKAVYDRQIGAVGSALTEALAKHPDDLSRRVRAGVDAFIEATTRDERAARVQLLEVVGVSDRLEAHRRDVLRAFAVLIEQEYADLRRRGLTTSIVPAVLCMALVGGSNEVMVDWIHSDPRRQLADVAEALVQMHLSVAGYGEPIVRQEMR